MLLRAAVLTYAWTVTRLDPPRCRARDDRGQATAEYALVLMGAAAVAVLLITWATKTGKVGQLLDAVLDNVAGRVK
jgi:Flp pilus assembly pilin Flp